MRVTNSDISVYVELIERETGEKYRIHKDGSGRYALYAKLREGGQHSVLPILGMNKRQFFDALRTYLSAVRRFRALQIAQS